LRPKVSGEDEVVKSTQKNVPLLAFVSLFVVIGLVLALPTSVPAQTITTTNTAGGTKNQFNQPPCDFSDAFYQENGVAAGPNTPLNGASAARFGLFRQTGPPASSFNGGTQNWVNDQTCGQNDPTRNQSTDSPSRQDVRILATTGAYKDDDGAPTVFFSLIAFLLNQNFFLQNFSFTQGDTTGTITNGLNPRGFSAQFIIGNFEAYGAATQRIANGTLAPTPCGSLHDKSVAASDCFSLGRESNGFLAVENPNLRQDWRISSNRNAIDGSDNNNVVGSGSSAKIVFNSPFGYFCDDLLGAWIVTYFWYTQNSVGGISAADGHTFTPTATCNTVLAQAASVNGTNLDGTPIIHTGNELHFIEGVPGTAPQFGFTQKQTNDLLAAMAKTGPCGAEGNLDPGGADGGAVWLICPTILDPRNGAIAGDAFPDVVFTSSGTPLDSRIINNFNCLRKTGLFCDGT
jgi:hypothetical protein